LSKSVLDIAQTSMAHVPATGGSVKVGATAQVGDKQVLILKQVADGGFGTVYLAVHSSSSRLYGGGSQAVRLRAYRPPGRYVE
jgi:hypothetical protein